MSANKFLFSQYDLGNVLRNQEQSMFGEVDSIESNELLNTSIEDLCQYFEQKYKLDPPRLKIDKTTVDQGETKEDVKLDFGRIVSVKGTKITYFIPFEGDPKLFRCKPSRWSPTRPRAVIRGNEVLLSYIPADHDANVIKSEFERHSSLIVEYLEAVERDVAPFNASIREKAHARLEASRKKLLADQGLVASLGFPLRRREGAPRTFVAPEVRRKIPVDRLSGYTAAYVPKPALATDEYEHILSVISNMVLVMERSPEAFRGMKEEDLRQHFLVQLNGQYEGQARGRTFNFEGKSDILIRSDSKNIFIAECKFWRGRKSLKDAIDQLLDYSSWRDTKTAILLFNREQNFSDVLAKIPEVIRSHSNCKRQVDYKSETGFRFVSHHRDDPNRELILTVLAFEVPK